MDRLEKIFIQQREHIGRFHPIQQQNGLLFTPTLPADPLTREGTLQLHLTIHWANLELFEAVSTNSFTERVEELADALHFIVEFCIVAGFDHTIIPRPSGNRDRWSSLFKSAEQRDESFSSPQLAINAVILAGLSIADILKNKPWKQSVRGDFDRTQLQRLTQRLLAQFGTAVSDSGATPEELYNAYFEKSHENKRRAQTGV